MYKKRTIHFSMFIVLCFLLILLMGCNADSAIYPEDPDEDEKVETDLLTVDEVAEEEPEQAENVVQPRPKYWVAVDVDVLRLRSGPGTDHEIINRLQYGTVLTVLREDQEWLCVKTADGQIGWVHGDYVKMSDERSVRIAEKAGKLADEADKTLRYLGMRNKEIIDLFGEPHLIFDVPGPGGECYVYDDIPISFIFAGQTEVVNNLALGKGAEIKGITIGMTLEQIEAVWGVTDSKGYDEGFINLGSLPWYAIYQIDSTETIVVYIFFKEEGGPSVKADVHWKSFW